MNKKEIISDILALFFIVGLSLFFILVYPQISKAIIDVWPEYAYLDWWIMIFNISPVWALIILLIILILCYIFIVFYFHIRFSKD